MTYIVHDSLGPLRAFRTRRAARAWMTIRPDTHLVITKPVPYDVPAVF